MTGAELRAKRESLGLSCGQLAKLCKIPGSFAYRLIIDYENGRWLVPQHIVEKVSKL